MNSNRLQTDESCGSDIESGTADDWTFEALPPRSLDVLMGFAATMADFIYQEQEWSAQSGVTAAPIAELARADDLIAHLRANRHRETPGSATRRLIEIFTHLGAGRAATHRRVAEHRPR